MKELVELYDIPVELRQVDIIHILNDGQVLLSKKEFENFEDRFAWVDRNQIISLVLELRPQTDSGRKSIIVINESGDIKTYTNISQNFTKYNLLNKAGL